MKKNSRLFTFGCSFTNWNWPTWADLLSVGYEHYENWGFAGIGNRAIAERVAESFVNNKFNENDTVIIQWSSHLRNDYAKTRSVDITGGMWQTKGAVVSPTNQHLYNETWFRNFWDEKAYYLHTLNNIVLVQQLLKSSGCKWYMTSINDLQNITLSSESTDPSFPTTNVWSLDSSLITYKESEILTTKTKTPNIILSIKELGYKHNLEDAKSIANDYIAKNFFHRDTLLKERENGLYSATDFSSYGATIIVEPIIIT
jgi:hypothetical protein